MALTMISLMVLFMLIGVPIAVCIGLPTLIYFLNTPELLIVLPQRMVAGLNNFSLLAVPLFILVGELMNYGGMTDRLFGFARALIGHIPGGLGHANVLASGMFASMSGSAVADVAGLGLIEMKAMEDAGYDKDFSIGITVASSTLGPIIPPSINMVLYGAMSGASIGALLLGGVVPGLLMMISMMTYIHITSHKRNYPRDPKPTLKIVWASFKRAFLPMLTPTIMIVGILKGVFTPTEAAAAAVLYTLFITGVVYKELTLDILAEVILKTCISTGVILIIIAIASPFGYALTWERVPQMIAEFLLSLSSSTVVLWLLVIGFLLVVGCFMEVAAALVVLVPIMAPALKALGFDLVHFGVIMVLTIGVGLITPPVGMCLYIGGNISKIGLERVIRATVPYIIPILMVILLCAFIPDLVVFIPKLFNMY